VKRNFVDGECVNINSVV